MHTRVDNYPIKRLSELALLVRTSQNIDIKSWFFSSDDKKQYDIVFTEDGEVNGSKKFITTTPNMNGFVLINVNGKPIVKKVGHTYNIFVYGYKKNMNIKCIKNNEDEVSLENIVDRFYYIDVKQNDVLKIRGKEFIMYNSELETVNISMTMNIVDNRLDMNLVRKPLSMALTKRDLVMTIIKEDDEEEE